MAPDVSGRIVELDVRDNQALRKGDVLFRIDPEPYRMRVYQARAAVSGLTVKQPGENGSHDCDNQGRRYARRQVTQQLHGSKAE